MKSETHLMKHPIALATVTATLLLYVPAKAQHWASIERSISLSEEIAGGANPGQAASKGKLTRLVNTPNGDHDGRLITVYGDANSSESVWDPKSLTHSPRDIFARYSDDEGKTWSTPVNVSNSANAYSAITDFDGDGLPQPFFGDCSKPTIFNHGDNIVISWVSKYCPESTWNYGSSGTSLFQGSIEYPDLAIFPNNHVVPYSGVYAAVSNDGGTTWIYGDIKSFNPPIQLTYGLRDAIQDAHRGVGNRWIMTWQEDPEGLQPGEADGPGDGASGAKATKGTDIWYTYTNNIATDPLALAANRTPLSNHSAYNFMSTGSPIQTVGNPGSIENHWATRANLFLLNVGGTITSLVAYEESKGLGDVIEGKTIQYHAFPFDAPVMNGMGAQRYGAAGETLTDFLENSRRVRFVAQAPNGVDPAICIFWKQGQEAQGAPSDIMLKTSLSVDETSVAMAPTLNVSAATPVATSADLMNSTSLDPLEDARAHRAYMRGSFIAMGYSYTPNQPLARFTTLENYDFWIRRSFDGGLTWDSPQNMTELDKSINVKEPRIVGPAKTGNEDPMSFAVAFGTETNVYEGLEATQQLDIRVCRTTDGGENFSTAMVLGDTEIPIDAADPDDPEEESQLRVNDDVSRVFTVWMAGGASNEVRYTKLTNEWFTPGDKLRVEFPEVGATVQSYFDALKGETVKLRLKSLDGKSVIRVDVMFETPVTSLLETVNSYEINVGTKKVAKGVKIKETGRYHLFVTHLDKGTGPIKVGTGRFLPKKALKRKLTLKPDPITLTAEVKVLALEGSLLDLTLTPKKGFNGPVGLIFGLPDGSQFDASSFMSTDGDLVLFNDVPLEEIGEYTLTVGGFSSTNESLVAVVKPKLVPKIKATISLP